MRMPDSIAQALMGEIDVQLTKLGQLTTAIADAAKDIKEAKLVTGEWRTFIKALPKIPNEPSIVIAERDTPEKQARRRAQELAIQEARVASANLTAEFVTKKLKDEIPNWEFYVAQQKGIAELFQWFYLKLRALIVGAIVGSCTLGIAIGWILSK
jgi:hypothetical protein